MLKVHKQEKAEDDLIDIWLYSLGEWDIAQADQYLNRLNQSIKSIAANPNIGIACDYVRAGYRKLNAPLIRLSLCVYLATKWIISQFCKMILNNSAEFVSQFFYLKRSRTRPESSSDAGSDH